MLTAIDIVLMVLGVVLGIGGTLAIASGQKAGALPTALAGVVLVLGGIACGFGVYANHADQLNPATIINQHLPQSNGA